jgi:hypothetical protein
MPEKRQRTIFYVDGFNLFYGALKRTPMTGEDKGSRP